MALTLKSPDRHHIIKLRGFRVVQQGAGGIRVKAGYDWNRMFKSAASIHLVDSARRGSQPVDMGLSGPDVYAMW